MHILLLDNTHVYIVEYDTCIHYSDFQHHTAPWWQWQELALWVAAHSAADLIDNLYNQPAR